MPSGPIDSGNLGHSARHHAILISSSPKLPTGPETSYHFDQLLSSPDLNEPARKDNVVILGSTPQAPRYEDYGHVTAPNNEAATAVTPEREPALRRRQDWTPPGDTVFLDGSDPSSGAELWSSPARIRGNEKNNVFSTLQASFGCKDDSESATGSSRETSGKPLFEKRKAIEMISVGGETAVAEATKQKTKKKPRTITELAVAAYADPSYAESIRAARAEMSLTIPNIGPAQPGDIACNPGHPTAKLRKRTAPKKSDAPKPKKTKAKAKGKTTRKAPAFRHVVLSPQSAIRETGAQDFMFGTSSQLALDWSSPTAPSRTAEEQDAISSASFLDLTGLPPRTTKLWGVAARTVDGTLSNDNIIHLDEQMDFPEDPEEVVFRTRNAASTTAVIPPDEGKTQPDQPKQSTKANSPPPSIISCGDSSPAVAPTRHTAEIQPADKVEQPAQPASLRQETNDVMAEPTPPNFETYTNEKLAKEVSSYGYKPIRGRTAMISLLSQCWKAQNHIVLTNASQTASMSTSAPMQAPRKPKATTNSRPSTASGSDKRPTEAASEKSGKKRPSRASQKSPRKRSSQIPTTEIFEIEDSQSEGRSSPEPHDLSDSAGSSMDSDTDSDEGAFALAEATDDQTELFQHITKAVVSAPRSNDVTKPSWHEKILMYDTIVLEALTDWLNEGQLGRVGYDEKVTSYETKQWCESKSICCTWRTNLHGKKRKLAE